MITGTPGNRKNKAAAFFDVDRTLIRGFSLELHLISRIMRIAGLRFDSLSGYIIEGGRCFIEYTAETIRAFQSKDSAGFSELLSILNLFSVAERDKGYLKGMNPGLVQSIAEDVAKEACSKDLNPRCMERISAHRERGEAVFLVSGSLDILVGPVAEQVGADGYAATELEKSGGRLTGRISGIQPLGINKKKAVIGMAVSKGIDLGVSYAYGDRFSDRFVLESVGHPVAVNPDPALHALSIYKGWEILS